jgi:adenylate kinase family enzyme
MIKRQLSQRVMHALKGFPVVFVNGPRQAGKSTFVQSLTARKWPAEYVTFDEATMLGAAEANPESFLRAYEGRLMLDEVQMVPGLFRVLKILTDEARLADKAMANGRYLLDRIGQYHVAAKTFRRPRWANERTHPLSVFGARGHRRKRWLPCLFKP